MFALPGGTNCISGIGIYFDERGVKVHDACGTWRSGLENRRPLSPHLQIYRPTLTMIMSISHRITGIALYFGTLLLAWLLIAASASPPLTRQPLLCQFDPWKTDLVRIHLGLVPSSSWRIRHIIWDTGHGFAYRSANGWRKRRNRRHCPDSRRLGIAYLVS